ncbi:hypothetical protein HELRODRAFT_160582 [Helobdella robusta]|uniref:Uncharacterized protein n=1 Tax=Helobdella robusta TaxID=6412 RepID=T1EQG1_HELRO|nr:hypothetical protein HELRODRAFT_160582 [Helobdella robusta]ESO06411.1 hypothetical protein HELRODRAFT_160582 [Helobdella robusta]
MEQATATCHIDATNNTYVQVEDSGYIGCKIGLPGVNSESFLPFNVVALHTHIHHTVPVYNMWWSSPSSSGADFNSMVFRPNEDLSFVEQEQVFFVCHVNGSYPQPRVRVHIGSEDISHYFASTARLIRVSGVRGLQPVYYSVELTNRSLSIDYRYNDKELKCSASMTPVAGGTWDVESTSIVVKITEYRPKIFCNKKLGIKIGENFTFSCIVKSSPKLHNLTFFKQASAHQHRKQHHHHKQQHLQQQIQPPKHQQSLIAATSTTKSMMPFMPLISRLPKTTTATTTKQMPLKFNNFNNHNNDDDDDNKNNNRNQDINDSNSNSKYSSTNKRNNNSKNSNSNGNNSDANYDNSDSNNSTDQFLDDFPPKLVTEDMVIMTDDLHGRVLDHNNNIVNVMMM